MKKIILACFVFIISTSQYNSVTPHYNPITKKIECSSYSCIHEVAHFIDNDISFSKEFREYFEDELFYGINGVPRVHNFDLPIKDIISVRIRLFGWGGWDEFYASKFAEYYGCENMMPESMRRFYNFKVAYKKLEQYGFDNSKICPIIQSIVHPMATLK